MENNINISNILREVITFLECLRDMQLPLALEVLREKLLTCSKDTLTTIARSSPEPYLDMNSGPKSILLKKSENDTEDYVGVEGSPNKQAHQDYYETFEPDGKSVATEHANRHNQNDRRGKNQILTETYKKLPASQSKNGCHKCGPLYRREGKKLFMPESRLCWVSLVGSHLLIYRSERQNHPFAMYSIREYMARPVPNILSRQKNETTFEVYCPGNETLQFIARTVEEMNQWIAKICEIGSGVANSGEKKRPDANKSPTNTVHKDKEARRRDAGKRSANDPKKKAELKSNKVEVEVQSSESPPPLPTRIPRRLPSLPSDDSMPSYTYKAVGNYAEDDDDIYYKIDDVNKGLMSYQNVMLSKKQRADTNSEEQETYDDIHAFKGGKDEKKTKEEKDNVMRDEQEEMYDDVMILSRANNTATSGERPVTNDNEKEKLDFYDDVESLSKNGGATKDRVKDQTEAPSKFQQKKSFLERVWSKRESPGKKSKVKASSVTEEMPTYDDISEMTSNQEFATNETDELPEYNCPPPPRPVCTKSPANPTVDEPVEELYDDISSIREQFKNPQRVILQSTPDSIVNEAKGNAINSRPEKDPAQEEIEHYQSPRSDLCVREAQQTEELYDDVALWEDFKARQRNANERKNSEDNMSTGQRIRNRFAINRKSRTNDIDNLSEANRRNGSENEENEDSMTTKRNTLQKLISRMENSLAKVSSRNPMPPASKPTSTSNVGFKP